MAPGCGSAGINEASWENGIAEPNPNNITFSRWDGAAWTVAAPAFATAVDQHVNDWSVLKLSDNDVHAVRRSLIGTYDHRRYDGAVWKSGAAIPTAPGVTGSGLVLAASGANVILLAIAADSTVRYAKWTPGGAQGAWGAWSAFEASTAPRSNLAGYSSPADGHSAVVWIEPLGGGFRIAGSIVPAL